MNTSSWVFELTYDCFGITVLPLKVKLRFLRHAEC